MRKFLAKTSYERLFFQLVYNVADSLANIRKKPLKMLYNIHVGLERTDYNQISDAVGPYSMAELILKSEKFTGDFIVADRGDKRIMLRGSQPNLETKTASMDLMEPGIALAVQDKKHPQFVDRQGKPTNYTYMMGYDLRNFPPAKLPVHAHTKDGNIIAYIREGGEFAVV